MMAQLRVFAKKFSIKKKVLVESKPPKILDALCRLPYGDVVVQCLVMPVLSRSFVVVYCCQKSLIRLTIMYYNKQSP